MDSFISTALERPLQALDLGLGDRPAAEEVRAFCDRFARRLVGRYLAGDFSWPDADAAANNIFDLMIEHCGGEVPTQAWDVYLAFDAGECTAPGGDAVTRPLIEQIARAFDSGE